MVTRKTGPNEIKPRIRSEKRRESRQKRTDKKVASKGHRRDQQKHKEQTLAQTNKQKATTQNAPQQATQGRQLYKSEYLNLSLYLYFITCLSRLNFQARTGTGKYFGALRGNMLRWYSHRNGMGMGCDGMETFTYVPLPVTIPSPSPNFLIPAPYHTISRNCSHPTQHTMINLFTIPIPYHLPQLLPSHPTHHDKTFYHPNTIPSVSHLSHVHTNTIVYHPKSSIRSLLREVPEGLSAF